MAQKQKTMIVPISIPSGLASALDRAAREESMTRSEYVRSLIRRQIGFNAFRNLQYEASKRSKRAGIRTLRDAVRAVRDIRARS